MLTTPKEGAAVVWQGYEGFLYHLGAGGPSYLGDRDKEKRAHASIRKGWAWVILSSLSFLVPSGQLAKTTCATARLCQSPSQGLLPSLVKWPWLPHRAGRWKSRGDRRPCPAGSVFLSAGPARP